MNYFRVIGRSSLLIGISIATAAIASCGESKSDTNGAATSANGDDNDGTMSGSGSLQPGSNTGTNGGSGAPASEGNPPVVMFDPDRDPTVPVNLIESGAVGCGGGGDFCVLPNLTCCTAGGGGMATFSCAPDASQCPDGTTSTASCSSRASCAAGEVCCRTGGGGGPGGGNATTTCEASCPDGAAQICIDDAECADGGSCNNGVCGPPACTATSCGDDQLCCRGMGGGQAAAPACAAPDAGGLCPAGRRQVCDEDTDCPAGNTCAPLFGGGGGGGATVCTPPPCTPGSCDADQVCCVGGGLGGNPTCSAASATGACPGNSRLVCNTDAECAPAAGTQCLTNPNGGGTLSCRVPPAPPAGADAGADGG